MLVLLLTLGSSRLTIRVSPPIIPQGSGVTITCHVPHSPDTRLLQMGIADGDSSLKELDGRDPYTRETYSQYFRNVSCDAEEAYCAVGYASGKSEVAIAAIHPACHVTEESRER